MTPSTDELDEIMEGLIVGHNFDYAAKTIRALVHQKELEAREDELENILQKTTIAGRWHSTNSNDFTEYWSSRVHELKSQLAQLNKEREGK